MQASAKFCSSGYFLLKNADYTAKSNKFGYFPKKYVNQLRIYEQSNPECKLFSKLHFAIANRVPLLPAHP